MTMIGILPRRSGKCNVKCISLVFTATLSLSLTAYVGVAAATRCAPEGGSGGNQCCLQMNDPCSNCDGTSLPDCLADMYYPSGSSDIPPRYLNMLAQAAERIRNLPPGTVIELGGYSDSTGSQASNLALSRMRAEAVRNELIRLGVPAQMLVVRSYGELRPLRSNATAADRIQNRRVSPWVIEEPR